MVWVKLDDKFYSDPKILEVGLAGAGLYAMGLSYCGAHLTDGFIPDSWARSHDRRLRTKLVHGGLWKSVPGGYEVSGFTKFNPSRANVLSRREKTAERVASWRDRNAVSNDVGNDVSNAAPDPARTTSTSNVYVDVGNDEQHEPPDNDTLDVLTEQAEETLKRLAGVHASTTDDLPF
jgi:hypothetical protein